MKSFALIYLFSLRLEQCKNDDARNELLAKANICLRDDEVKKSNLRQKRNLPACLSFGCFLVSASVRLKRQEMLNLHDGDLEQIVHCIKGHSDICVLMLFLSCRVISASVTTKKLFITHEDFEGFAKLPESFVVMSERYIWPSTTLRFPIDHPLVNKAAKFVIRNLEMKRNESGVI